MQHVLNRLLPENLRGEIRTYRHFRMFIQRVFGFDLGVSRHGHFDQLMEYENDIEFLGSLPPETLGRIISLVQKSRAQNRQDVFALACAAFKTGGFFVEFGATNGIDLSNTFLLESEFAWTGILAEPAKSWHDDLIKNRKCHVDFGCVWTRSNETIKFVEADIAENSTIQAFDAHSAHRQTRETGRTYDVATISLVDLLKKYDAPQVVDFLSIDTEGSELAILTQFDFDRYQFKAITCEHNFRPDRQKICSLLQSKGYVRKFVGLSKWDDWYVQAT